MNQTYPDGFPLTPQEAIEFSYFLSESEKQEWREWLKSATPEQQNELVDILHSMWQDNQKQAIPEAFNGNGGANFNPQTPPNQPNGAFSYNPNQNFSQPQNAGFNAQFPPQIPPSQPFAQNPNPYPNPQFQQNNHPQQTGFNPQFPPQIPPSQPFAQNPNPYPNPQFQQNSQPQQYQQQPPQQNIQNTGSFPPAPNNPFDLSGINQTQPAASNQAQQSPSPLSQDTNEAEEEELPHFDFQEDIDNDEDLKDEPFKYSEEDKYGDEEQEVALRKMANAKYTPNPVLEDKTPPPEEFVYKNGNYDNDDEKESIEDENPEDENEEQDDNNSAKRRYSEEKKKFFSSSKIRESATREALEDIYQSYIDSRDKKLNSQKEYDSNNAAFLDKVMNVVSNFDEISDYYETIIERILEVNDKVVDQAKEIQQLKNNTQSRGGISLQDQIDELRDDIDRLNRDLRTSRSEQRRKYDDISTQVASFGADAYRQDGVIQRIDLMKSEIIQLQQKLGFVSDKNISPKLPVSTQNRTNSDKDSHQTIDLRGIV